MQRVRIALAQLAPALGALEDNLERHRAVLEEARDGGANLIATFHTLTSSDGGKTWLLGGLDNQTGPQGTYVLTVNATGSGIVDAGGNDVVGQVKALTGGRGVAIAGSVTASHGVLGELQVAAGHDAGLSPTLVAAGNSTGGVLAKMLSPQHLAIAAAAASSTSASRPASVKRP